MYKFSNPQKDNNLNLCELCILLMKYIMWNIEEMHIKQIIKSLAYVINKHRNIVTEDIIKDESDAV